MSDDVQKEHLRMFPFFPFPKYEQYRKHFEMASEGNSAASPQVEDDELDEWYVRQ